MLLVGSAGVRCELRGQDRGGFLRMGGEGSEGEWCEAFGQQAIVARRLRAACGGEGGRDALRTAVRGDLG